MAPRRFGGYSEDPKIRDEAQSVIARNARWKKKQKQQRQDRASKKIQSTHRSNMARSNLIHKHNHDQNKILQLRDFGRSIAPNIAMHRGKLLKGNKDPNTRYNPNRPEGYKGHGGRHHHSQFHSHAVYSANGQLLGNSQERENKMKFGSDAGQNLPGAGMMGTAMVLDAATGRGGSSGKKDDDKDKDSGTGGSKKYEAKTSPSGKGKKEGDEEGGGDENDNDDNKKEISTEAEGGGEKVPEKKGGACCVIL